MNPKFDFKYGNTGLRFVKEVRDVSDLYSVYEISKSGYGVRVREKTCVIAQNLRGQVPDIIF